MPTPKILPGKHENMTAAGLRRHYEAGCRHDACTAASTAADPATRHLQAAGIITADLPAATANVQQLLTAPIPTPDQSGEVATPPEAVAPTPDFDVDISDELAATMRADLDAADLTPEPTGSVPVTTPKPARKKPGRRPAATATAAQVITNLLPDTPTPAPPAPFTTGRTSARGATRRIRGLLYVGFTPVQIAQGTSTNLDDIWWLLLGRIDTVADTTHARIATRARDLVKHIPDPTNERSRALAVDSGWRSYFAWDSIDTDADAA